jgi:hypothetical protein
VDANNTHDVRFHLVCFVPNTGEEMKLKQAEEIINETWGKSYEYWQQWGLSTIREAVRTVLDRKTASKEIKELAEEMKYKIYMGSITPKHWREN